MSPSSTSPGAASSAAPTPAPSRPWRDAELTNETTHHDLLEAILGEAPRSLDDRHALVAAVDAQVKSLREELGLTEPVVVEPPPPPAPPPTLEPAAEVSVVAPSVFGASLTDSQPSAVESTLSVVRKVPGWFKQVAAQARQKRP